MFHPTHSNDLARLRAAELQAMSAERRRADLMTSASRTPRAPRLRLRRLSRRIATAKT